jgi:3-deoxy-D-manno-octulosonate 8-phosphate phosphatase (KDO 8-P phosphatase)
MNAISWPIIVEKAKKIKMLVLDVDGVLTDGKLFFDNDGNEYKAFHARDGHGLKLLRHTGVEVAVISGRNSPIVAQRMKMLGIEYVYQGHENKRSAFGDILQKCALKPNETAFMGDDILDLPIMRQAGLAITVKDANFAVKPYVDWCTESLGGQGAVREVCDFLMQAQGTFEAVLSAYLQP